MLDINDAKKQLLDNLWLPTIRKGGDILYPRLRKNKKMRVLTLTAYSNSTEIDALLDEELSQKERITAWSHSLFGKFRLETEIASKSVFGSKKYEDEISNPAVSFVKLFPFDIVNLDFSSQEPIFEKGRIEKEIMGLERTILLQRKKDKFVLIYTTILNSNQLDLDLICTQSNQIPIHRKDRLVIEGYPPQIFRIDQKRDCIESVLGGMLHKHEYTSSLDRAIVDLQNQRVVFSLAGILTGGDLHRA